MRVLYKVTAGRLVLRFDGFIVNVWWLTEEHGFIASSGAQTTILEK
jgi:hypothetical protein